MCDITAGLSTEAKSPPSNRGYVGYIKGVVDQLETLSADPAIQKKLSGVLSNLPVKNLVAIDSLSKADTGNVQQIAASQISLMNGYYEMALAQSRKSFNWALTGAGVGLIFFMAAAGFSIWEQSNITATIIPVITGAVVEVISGIVFFLYGKTTAQLGDFHSRLQVLQRYLLANSICESLDDTEKNKARAELIREIARIPMVPVAQ